MNAAVVVRTQHSYGFKITRVAIPEITPSDLLVRLSVTGVCGTDIALASGKLGPCCDILGHEGIGYVVKKGCAVPDDAIQIGDRVAIAWYRDVCGQCTFCLHPGGETRCSEQLNSGRKMNGSFAEYALVPSRYIISVPKTITVDDELIAPIVCGGVTAYKAIKVSGTVPGQWIAIFGAGGGVGSLAIQYARAMGYRPLAIDAGRDKGDHCLSVGAEGFIDVLETANIPEEVIRRTNTRGPSTVLVCTGVKAAYETALETAAPFGTVVCVGILPPDEKVAFSPLLLIDKDIRIISSSVGTRQDILEAIDFVHRGLVRPSIIRGHLEDLPSIANEFGKDIGKHILEFRHDKNISRL